MSFIKNILFVTKKNLSKNSLPRRAWRKLAPAYMRERLGDYMVRPKRHVPEYIEDLNRIGRQFESSGIPPAPKKRMKILFGPSFAIHAPCFVHDRIFSYAMRLRGAEIIPVYCDSAQYVQCNFYGGDWMPLLTFRENCKDCLYSSGRLWEDNPAPPVKISRYLRKHEIAKVTKKVKNLGPEEWSTYSEEGFPFGKWARDILVNNYLVSDYHLVPDYHSLGIAHLKNLLLLKIAYQKILDEVKPDRVISNDSYYGMWAILQKLCEKKGIPFYGHWPGARMGAWWYAYNERPIDFDFSKPWKNYSRIPLDKRRREKAEKWLSEQATGEDTIFEHAPRAPLCDGDFELSQIDSAKPTALLPANIAWDLTSLDKQIVFKDMIDWIAETIRWFAAHPGFQLIIKPHPAETMSGLPPTRETVKFGLERRALRLPKNVFLLLPNDKLTVYELFPMIHVGLVHTSTTTLEMAARGLPVITTARSRFRGLDFTIDPVSQKEYFDFLERTLKGEKIIDKDSQIERAYKFILFFQYHHYIKTDIIDFAFQREPQLKIDTLEELLPGNNRGLDYVLDSIIQGEAIASESRWPPES